MQTPGDDDEAEGPPPALVQADCCDLTWGWADRSPILLDIAYPTGSFALPGRDPIYLAARTLDLDELEITCSDPTGARTFRLADPDIVIIDWTLLNETLTAPAGTPPPGPGPAGYLIGRSGEQALYVPAFVPCRHTMVAQIRCKASNTNTGKLRDSIKRAVITLTVTRDAARPSHYRVTVTNQQKDNLSSADWTTKTSGSGGCEPVHGWVRQGGINASSVRGPLNNTVCPGESTVLGVAASNLDKLQMGCKPRACGGPVEVSVWDTPEYEWVAARGTFPCGPRGSTVIYRAPKQRGADQITCMVRDSRTQFVDAPVTVTLTLRIDIDNELRETLRLLAELGALEQQWATAGDLRAQFVTLQKCIALRVMDDAYFDRFNDPCSVLRLLNNFVRRFLDMASGRSPSPLDWDVAFTEAARIQAQLQAGASIAWTALGQLLGPLGIPFTVFDAQTVATSVVTLLMASAHIDTDLRAALKDEGCGDDADFQSVFQDILGCEQANVPYQVQLVRRVAVAFGLPLANSIQEWRDRVRAEVCDCR